MPPQHLFSLCLFALQRLLVWGREAEKQVGYRKWRACISLGELGSGMERECPRLAAITSPEAGSWGPICLPALSPGQPLVTLAPGNPHAAEQGRAPLSLILPY